MEEKGDHVSSLEEEGELGAIGRRFRVPPPFLTFLLRKKKREKGEGPAGKENGRVGGKRGQRRK